jgi:ribonuclease HII
VTQAAQLDWHAAGGLIAGVDEVGRGPLAGPVVAAAVILDPERPIAGLRDSKLLTPKARTRLAREIRLHALAFAVAAADHGEIDSLNILEASLVAMRRAVLRLKLTPARVIVDGNQVPRFPDGGARYIVEARVRGDQSVPSVSAASILAKVCRDRLMCRWDRRYPGYAFASNKGYPTAAHLEGLRRLGPCDIHRRSFAPVRELGARA